MNEAGVVVVDHEVEAPFVHSTGPGLSRFFTALRDDQVILGRRCDRCAKVAVPSLDYCETCGHDAGELVELGSFGRLEGFTVVHRAMPQVGLDPPFAFVRVRLDGADTDLFHLATEVHRLERGGRVRAVWAPERTGTIRDIAGFSPVDLRTRSEPPGQPGRGTGTTPEAVTAVRRHLRLPFHLSAGAMASAYHQAVRRGEILGVRCTVCSALYASPRPLCGRCWAPCKGWEHLGDTGTVDTFVVINVPFYGQEIDIPYVLANIRLDGADSAISHLVGRVNEAGRLAAPKEGIRIGMRVAALWVPRSKRRGYLNDDIDHFEPTGEKGVDFGILRAR